jgi:hypothetical protein
MCQELKLELFGDTRGETRDTQMCRDTPGVMYHRINILILGCTGKHLLYFNTKQFLSVATVGRT